MDLAASMLEFVVSASCSTSWRTVSMRSCMLNTVSISMCTLAQGWVPLVPDGLLCADPQDVLSDVRSAVCRVAVSDLQPSYPSAVERGCCDHAVTDN